MMRLLLSLAIALFLVTQSSTAQERLIPYEPGTPVTLTIAPGEPVEKISLFHRSEGNEALSVRASIDAPIGLAVNVRHLGFPLATSTEAMVSSPRAFDTAELARPGKVTFRETSVLGDSEDPRKKTKASKQKFICDGRVDARLKGLYEALFGFTNGYRPSEAELCRFATGDTTTPVQAATTVKEELRGVVYKNACVSNLSYLVVLTLDLSTIPAPIRSAGFTVNLTMELTDYTGIDNFKVKRLGEGKYKEPLLIGEAVQTDDTFQQLHVVMRYSGGKVRTRTELMPKKATYYRGMGLFITTPRGLLTGGRGVACTSNGGAASCNCIQMKATDQLFRGYSNG